MVELNNGHICKNLTQNGEPQKYSWGMQKKKEEKKKKPDLFLGLDEDVPSSQVAVHKLLLLQVHHAPGNLRGPQVQLWLGAHLLWVV